MTFQALVTEKTEDGKVSSSVQTIEYARLPPGEVTVAIDFAGLNYKDGLCLLGKGGLVRNFPHVAGIDFAGTVEASDDPRYVAGQKVILTGWRVGETQWGAYAQKARVKADFLVPLPETMTTRQAMVLGTAGLTAMLAIDRLETLGLTPEAGEVLVTGAGGGVGSIAIMMLKKLGYRAVALTGRAEMRDALLALGASDILLRSDFLDAPAKPLETARFAGAIDNVGGKVLSRLLKQIVYGGSVAAIGNAGGIEIETNVLPFILRGITLAGIDSVMQPYQKRVAAWDRLAQNFDFSAYEGMIEEVDLTGLSAAAERILAGEIRGRVIVKPR